MTFSGAILERMKAPIYKELVWNFLYPMTNESDRGAVLIGTEIISEHLEAYLEECFRDISKKMRNSLIKYPGPFSSLSGKMKILYSLRLLDQDLYHSLTTLRFIRNTAAHSRDGFVLIDYEPQINKISEFEKDWTEIVLSLAYDNLIKWKRMNVNKIIEEFEEQIDPNHIKRKLDGIPSDPEVVNQLRIWRLATALTLICLKLDVMRIVMNGVEKNYLFLKAINEASFSKDS